MSPLRLNILNTLAFFLAQDFPPTFFEVWRHLLGDKNARCTLWEVKKELLILKEEGLIFENRGFFFFHKMNKLVSERIRKQKISAVKIFRLKKWARLLSLVPFVRAIFVTGALAMKKADINSDWDVIVVLAKKRIWLGRFLTDLILRLVMKRRSGEKVRNRFCLNHFLTEDGLMLEEQNDFSASEVAFSFPILGEKYFHRFLLLNLAWMKNFKPNFEKDHVVLQSVLAKPTELTVKTQEFLEMILEKIGLAELGNKLCKKVMIWKIRRNPETSKSGADIRYSDQALIFLPKPKRVEVERRKREIMESLQR